MRICDLLGEADFPGTSKPADGSYIESFNSGFRQECLNQQVFDRFISPGYAEMLSEPPSFERQVCHRKLEI